MTTTDDQGERAQTFPPETFGAWTLRQLSFCGRPCGFEVSSSGVRVCVQILEQSSFDIETDSGSIRTFVTAPIAAIERLLQLRREALAPVAPEGSCDWLDQEIAEAERAVYALADLPPSERSESLEQAQERLRALEDVRDHLPPVAPVAPSPSERGAAFEAMGREPDKMDAADQAVAIGRPAVASERPGLTRLLEWARANGSDECLGAIEREIAALTPLAGDLRTPEPGAFDGAYVVGVDLAKGDDVARLSAIIPREAINSAVRGALTEVRALVAASSISGPGGPKVSTNMLTQAIDRLAERFK